jgi:hypothetical protein
MKKKNRLLRPLWALTMLVGMGLSNQAFAATLTWTGATNNNWNNAGNWSPSSVPAAGDDAIIPDGSSVTYNGGNGARTITLNGSGTLALGANLSVAQTTDGGIYLNGTGSVTVGAYDLTIGSTSYRGDVVVASTGTFAFSTAVGNTTSISGVITNAGGGTITTVANTNLTLNGTTNCVLPAGIKLINDLIVNKTGASVTLSDDLTITATTGSIVMQSGALNVGNNDLVLGSHAAATAPLNIESGATLNADYTDANSVRDFQAVTVKGTGVLSSSGPSGSSANNNFWGVISLGNTTAGSTLNIANSKSSFAAASTLAFPNAASLNANGADVTLLGVGADYFTGSPTLFTDAHSNLTLSVITSPIGTFPSISDLNNLTITTGQLLTLNSNLTLNGNLTVSANGLALGGKTLTVNGEFNNAGGTISAASSSLVLNGPVTLSANWGTAIANLVTDLNTSLTIGGSGALKAFPNTWVAPNLGNVTMNRSGANLDFTNLTGTLTFNSLNIANGTVTAPPAQVLLVSTTTAIGTNGVLDAPTTAAMSRTFTKGLSGTGKIIATGSGANRATISFPNDVACVYTFTGDIITNASTILDIATPANSNIDLPSSISSLYNLNIATGALTKTVTLNNDLAIQNVVAAANFASGKLLLNGNNITFNGTYGQAAAANFILDAKNNSGITFNGAPTFETNGISADETTDMSINAAASLDATITKLKNLNIVSNTTALLGPLEVYGNLSVTAGTFDKATFALTVAGDVSNSGTFDIDGATGIVTLKGQLSGSATTSATTNLVIAGSGDQFVMPSAVATLGTLTLNRASGMRLNANLALGDGTASDDLVLTNGDLDLNGNLITLATATGGTTDVIKESAGSTIINTGATDATHGNIATPSLTAAEIKTSGVGVVDISAGNYTVKRYPTIVPIAGVGLSASRVYEITGTPTSITLQYDNSEAASNPAGLKLYTSAAIGSGLLFTTFTEQTKADGSNRTVNQNTPTGKGNVAYSNFATNPLTGAFFALASTPGSGGVLYTAAQSGEWTNSAVWSPNGVPTKLDQVYVGPYTITLKGNGSDVYCQSLALNHNSAKITPYDNTTNGDNVTINVMGNLQVSNGASIDAINNYGRINVVIGDGATAGVSSTIIAPASYVEGNGLSVNNLTFNGASGTMASGMLMRLYGDLKFVGNSAFTNSGDIEFFGGSNSTQKIDVPSSASLDLKNLTVTNSAALTTSSNMIVRGAIQTNPNSTFIADGGTVTFPEQTQGLWAVQNGSTLRLFNVEIGNSGSGGLNNDLTPSGNVEIAGNFTKFGANTFLRTSAHTITFKNTNQKELVASGTAPDFYNVVVAPNSSVKTSSSFSVYGDIDVQQNASLVADNGTITMAAGASPSYIKNVSDHTLNFFNLAISDNVLTSDNWKISGNLNINNPFSLKADKGTITFENVAEKTITNDAANSPADLSFFGLKITDGSKIKTSATVGEGEFTIKNNASNLDGAGLFVEGNGQFVVTALADALTFDAGAGVTAGHPKTISKSENGVLKLGLMNIAASTNNEVATSSDFEIQGTGASAFSNAGAGGKFVASAGTIKFTGATPIIASVSPAVTTFNSILTEGATDLKIADNNEFNINGDITVNGTSQINPTTVANAGKINLTGSSDQTIGGTSTIPNAVEIGKLVINKANDSHVLMNTDVEISSHANSQFVLTNGILNLGSKKLTNAATIISRLNGAINGANGTYIVSGLHKTPLLEDAYFTVNGEPTLNNLTVSAAHTTANDLTVNGTLNLNAGALTIASGSSASAAKQLILNGNLSKTSGTLSGSPANSRLVLQGNGVVVGGLQDNFFAAANQVPSITIARQENLGGDLTMDAAGNLLINSGVKYLDLGARKLTLGNTGKVTRVSGSITAGLNSTVNFGTITNVPANLFTNNQVGNFISGITVAPKKLYLDGDLAVMTSLNMPNDVSISTGDNTVTFGPNMTFSNPMGSGNYVMGNLIRTINANGVTEFPIGLDGTSATYKPLSMRLATPGNTQLVKVGSKEVDPTIGRGGNAKNAVNVTWNIAPQGTVLNDSVLVKFQYTYSTSLEQTLPVTNGAFPAKWNGNSWTDYRDRLATFTVAPTRVVTMSGYPVSLTDATGDWGLFTVDANTNAAKDKAISVTANKVVITKIDPSDVIKDRAFKVTVQLQDKNGQPITATSPFNVRVEKEYGSGALSPSLADAIIPVGSSMTTITGVSLGTPTKDIQLRADTLGGSGNWQPTLSNPFSVLDELPAIQLSDIAFSNVKGTSMTISWKNNDVAAQNTIVLAKAESFMDTKTEFPVNTNTYVANANFGSGSSIGNATVIYKGSTSGSSTASMNVTGLSPNTTYYFYVLAYTGNEGNENYKTESVPASQKTTGSTDDDVAFGSNNTRETSKAIGTNTPVTGTIGSATDEDWFNFSVTNATPNVRAQLSGLPNNYNIELYDASGRRIRRGIRANNGAEGPVVNNLPAGTYTIRVYSADGSNSATGTYTLKVATKSSEIFSVTP